MQFWLPLPCPSFYRYIRELKAKVRLILLTLSLVLSSSLGIGLQPSPVVQTAPKQVQEVKLEVKAEVLNAALLPVCSCESSYEGTRWGEPQQFNKDGTLRRGKQNRQDVGMCQINEHYHLAASKKLGMDIYTKAGNIAYANYLYKHQGLGPWGWSKHCWQK